MRRNKFDLKCKDITAYRYGSKEEQVLSFDFGKRNRLAGEGEMLTTDAEYSGGCAAGACPF